MKSAKSIVFAAAGAAILMIALLFFIPREDRIHLLYVTDGKTKDASAYDNFRQTLVANASMDEHSLSGLSERSIRHYDAVYLDVSLAGSDLLHQQTDLLTAYVKGGGRLLLENEFLSDFPQELLGARDIRSFPTITTQKLDMTYPTVDADLQDMQTLMRAFGETFNNQIGWNSLPGFVMGKGIVPDTAVSLVNSGDMSLLSVNKYGAGSVLVCSGFLPNRYFITGFDMKSGIDPARGFAEFTSQYNKNRPDPVGISLFSFKRGIPMEPFFHYAFATANYQLRSAFLTYVSKDKLGYSIEKALGPYGRPAMAFQNHFEAMPAFRDKEAIQWAELLKSYKEIPTFSLIRASFNWGVWKEGLVVHLNTGTSDKPQFTGEYANSFYSSGAFIASGGKPLTLAAYPEYRELAAPLELPYRAYPALADLNGDGKPDLIVGSADGKILAFMNQGAQAAAYAGQPLPAGLATPDAFGEGQQLETKNGKPLAVSAYAAPTVYDGNGDGKPDLIIGDEQGRVWLALGEGGNVFSTPVPVTAGTAPIQVASYAAPALGDVDGDGTVDLVVGDGDGTVHAFRGRKGSPMQFEAGKPIVKTGKAFAAPAVRDMNGDKKADLVIGSTEGDLQIWLQNADGSWSPQGSVTGQTQNMMGTNTLVGGHNSVPLWYDSNHDGKDDLIVGQVQFGGAVPVDDPAFPYAKQLTEFINYAKTNKLEILPHVYVHNYVSAQKEKQELQLQQQSFAKLGLPWGKTGTNQHTWRVNNDDRLQTLRNENEADIWYNFGFRVPHAPDDPIYSPETSWQLPFLLNDDKLKQPMMLYTPANQFKDDPKYLAVYAAMAALDMPIDYFQHIEYSFPATTEDDNPAAYSEATRASRLAYDRAFAEYFDRLRTSQDYNFMTEPQMAQSFLTAMKGKVTVSQSWGTYLLGRLKDRLGKGKHHLSLTLKPDVKGVPAELAGAYRDTLGVIVKPGSRYAEYPLAVDSNVFLAKGDVLYVGLSRPGKLAINWKAEPFHVERSNVPFEMKKLGSESFRIDTKADGMQQIKLYSPTPVSIEGTDLQIEQNDNNQSYTITHYGAAVSFTVKPTNP